MVACNMLLLKVFITSVIFNDIDVHNVFVNGFTSTTMIFSENVLKSSIEINIQFTTDHAIEPDEVIVIQLPLFTRRPVSQLTETRKNNNALDIINGIGSSSSAVGNKDSSFYDLDYGYLTLSPSTVFFGAWKEGSVISSTYSNTTAFQPSEVHLKMKPSSATSILNENLVLGIPFNVPITLTLSKSNDIKAYCGFPSSHFYQLANTIYQPIMQPYLFTMYSYNTSKYSLTNLTYFSFEEYDGLGEGCLQSNNCYDQGGCNYCTQTCKCNNGYGSRTDIITTGLNMRPDCSHRVCPSGKAISQLPTSATQAHSLAECSNMGLCDRSSGVCNCFPPYTGAACNRLSCPNDCSNQGSCLSMAELANTPLALSLTRNHSAAVTTATGTDTTGTAAGTVTVTSGSSGGNNSNPGTVFTTVYGTPEQSATSAWDYNVMYACLCDSSWSVGYAAGQTQLSEYFGADCSQRHCPSGDDPYTAQDETDCEGVYQYQVPGSRRRGSNINQLVGEKGNKCHIDCSNRGVCDYTTGKCKCYSGSYGDNCAQIKR